MYHSQAPYQQQQLPFPVDRIVDANTMRQGLPQSNDIWPAITPPPGLNHDIVRGVISEFRTHLQNRTQRGPVQTFAYNLMSQNYFNNPAYIEWCQYACDFTEFLIVAQNNPPNIAVAKAAEKIYLSALATMVGQFPALQSYIDRAVMDELIARGQEFNSIIQDLTIFVRNGRRPVSFQNQPMQTFGPNTGYQPRQLPPIAQMAPGGYQQTVAPAAPQGMSMTSPISNTGSGRYAAEPPLESYTSWRDNVTIVKSETPAKQFTITPPTVTTVEVEEPMAPASVDDVIIDPWHYIPRGVTIDEYRPFDHFYNPGGVEIKPAHLSKWTRTRTDAQPYALGYDPTMYVLFHVKWPDGLVQEKLAKWVTEMDYLAHEINDAIRATRARPTGKVVLNRNKVIDMTLQPAEPAEKVKEYLDDVLNVTGEMAPVLLEEQYAGNSDMENEAQAFEDVKVALNLPKDSDVMIPHEYVSINVHPLDISEECESRLMELHQCSSLGSVADGLRLMFTSGVLPMRYYRFIDQMLAEGVNRMLRDNLSISKISIDSFVDDFNDLIKLLRDKQGMEVVQLVNGKTRSFLQRHLRLSRADVGLDSERLVIAEEKVNLQTTWTYESLGSLNMTRNQAVLINQSTHPKIHGVLTSLITRRKDEDSLNGRTIRLITADGVYIEVVDGWLVAGAILIKRL